MREGTALVLQHGSLGPPGLLADWAAARGIPMDVHRVDLGTPLPGLADRVFVASLGSRHSPNDTHVEEVVSERAYLAQALREGVPVLGLCFGGQMLASLLGANIEAAPVPELGWHLVETIDDREVSSGPWLQWHFHTFTTPPGSVELARSSAGCQAFRHGRHLGVQFHPESTVDIALEWARIDQEQAAAVGQPDAAERLEKGRQHADASRASALGLFDSFFRLATS